MLRTVTFSDANVAEVVNDHFVAAWFNRSPGFCNSDSRAETGIFAGSGDAFLTKNICTFVMTPEGVVFHYVAGYVSPEIFLRFLGDALSLRREAFDASMRIRQGGLETLRRLHGERAATFEKESQEEPSCSALAAFEYRGTKHVHQQRCGWAIREAWKYLGRVHRSWEKVEGLPSLGEVQFKYLYGNPFSEEGPGASPIAADPAVLIARRCGPR